ncbi:high mobility group box domain-containing protein, partial [Suillus spraguei]
DGLPRKRKREKKTKDPNAPKGPASAYILFQNDIRSAYKKEHPDMSNKELLRLIGDQWKALSEDKKDFYRDQHGTAKKKHEVDLAAYNAQNPDHVPAEAKNGEKKKKKKEEESEHPATKEVAKAAPKTTKKAAVPVRSFVPVVISADVAD